MRFIIIVLLLVCSKYKSFCQNEGYNIDSLLANELVKRGELSYFNKDDTNLNFFKRNLFLDSTILGFRVLKFGMRSTHSPQYFCYIFPKKVLFAKSIDLSNNLENIALLLKESKIHEMRMINLVDKILKEIKNDNPKYQHRGNLPIQK